MTAARKLKFKYTRPWMYPKQEEAIFSPKRFSVIEGTTKSGKTVSCLAWIFEEALKTRQNENHWWVSPIFAQAKIAYRRLKVMIKRKQGAIKKQHGKDFQLFEPNETELKITLFNGSVIWFKSADNADSLYGEDVFSCVIDEASRVKEESWYAIRSTLTATRARCRIIGNVKGRSNWFYKMARRAESGEKDMDYFKITANDAVIGGVVAKDEVEGAKRDLPAHIFKMLYMAEPSDDDGNPFKAKFIEACTKPLSTKPVIVYGVDLAKSIDWTVIIGLDEDGNVAAFHRWQGSWETTSKAIIEICGNTPTLVDSTGVGDVVLEKLQKGGSNFEGFKFSSASKQQIMEGLQLGLETSDIGFPDGHIVRELHDFEYEYTRTGVRYSAPQGLHDDCVCALALAYHKLRHNNVALLDYYARQEAQLKQQKLQGRA